MPLQYELRSSPVFADLYDEEITRILSSCVFSEHEPGSTICEPEDPEALYFILKGKASLVIAGADKPLEYRTLSDSGVVFERMFNSDLGRRFTLTAKSVTQTMTLTTDRMFALYRLDPKIYGIFITNLLSQMFRDSLIANGLIARIFFSDTVKIGLPIYPSSRRKVWDSKMRKNPENSENETILTENTPTRLQG